VNQNADIRAILRDCRTVAVVGLSPRAERDSHRVARYMQQQGWRIVPVNPMAQSEILGESVYPSLTDAAHHVRIDLVNCFRRSEEIAPLVEEALSIGASAIWMQLGVEDEAAARRARAAGLRVVQNRCLKIDHAQNQNHE
jgi:predicted CoA-binding protein